MPVSTMVTETDASSYSRRRAREAARIYRPPAARSQRINNVSPKHYEDGSMYQEQLIQQQQKYLVALKDYHNTLQQHSNDNRFSEAHPYQCYSPNEQNDYREVDGKQKSRRPDQQFYVPRRKRHPGEITPCATPTPGFHDYEDPSGRAPSPTNSICSVVSEFSGRNRYNNNRFGRPNNQMPFHEEENRLYGKPPTSISRESTPGLDKNRSKGGLFSSETLQLIEKCINHDSRKSCNSPTLNMSGNNSPNNHLSGIKNNSKDFCRSPTAIKDNHPVHSKENLIHPIEVDSWSKYRRGRRNRKMGCRSRDPSLESIENHSRRNSINNENRKVFFNSSTVPFERNCSSNYDRLNSRNSSRASSRNPSVERSPCDSPYRNEWSVKGYSNPTSPVKHSSPPSPSVERFQRRHSIGKPPTSGRLISMPNVSIDLQYDNTSEFSKTNEPVPCTSTQNLKPIQYNESVTENCQQKELELQNFEEILVIESPNCNQGKFTDNLNEKSSLSCDPKEGEEILDLSLLPYTPIANSEDQILSQRENVSLQENIENLQLTIESCEINESASPIFSSDNEDSQRDIVNTSCENTEESSSLLIVPDQYNISVSSSSSTTTEYGNENVSSISEGELSLKDEISSSNQLNVDSTTTTIDSCGEDTDTNPKIFSFSWADEVDQVEEDSWDTLYDDSGNCLDFSVRKQLNDAIGKIKLEKPANDYYDFKPQELQITDEEYGHVIEIYDFPSSFQTQDLMSVFQDYKSFELKWVDDTHALGIFCTSLVAADSLNFNHPMVKTRPLSKATHASKTKALRISDAHLPYKPRPQTSVALARRLVSGALGLKVHISKEQRDAERQKLKAAKEKKKLIAKQKEDAWEGTICNA